MNQAQQPEALRLADAMTERGTWISENSHKAAAELRRLHARVQELEAQRNLALAKQAWDRGIKSPECHCEACDIAANGGLRSRMSLCPQCGNKRCPQATHHDNACTGSNAPGQKGSNWENVMPAGEELERDHSDEDAAIAAGKVQAAVQGRVG